MGGSSLVMKTTRYFDAMRQRPDCQGILDAWVLQVVHAPIKQVIQADGRIRRWAPIAEAGGRVLRVILLEDGQTIHNAFFDRGFTA